MFFVFFVFFVVFVVFVFLVFFVLFVFFELLVLCVFVFFVRLGAHETIGRRLGRLGHAGDDQGTLWTFGKTWRF